jgi:hypothetical protein
MIRFFLLANKQGQTRLSRYYEYLPVCVRAVIPPLCAAHARALTR